MRLRATSFALSCLLASIACAQVQTQSFTCPFEVSDIKFTPDASTVVAHLRGYPDTSFLNLQRGTSHTPQIGAARFSSDSKFWVGLSQGHLYLVNRKDESAIDLGDDDRSAMGFAFSPKGHMLAILRQVDHAKKKLEIYQGGFGLERTFSDLPALIDPPQPLGMQSAYGGPRRKRVQDWIEQGIVVGTGYGGRDTFIVNPSTGAVQPNRRSDVYKVPEELADGSIVDTMGDNLARSWNGRTQRVLFTQFDFASPGHTRHFEVAKAVNLLMVYGTSNAGQHTEVWVVNVANGAKRRILSLDHERQASTRDEFLATISPDGKWVAYRDCEDLKKVDVIPVPNIELVEHSSGK
jgi:hypothetical protein